MGVQRDVRRWFSGRMLACHAGGPGSIPGRRIFSALTHFFFFFLLLLLISHLSYFSASSLSHHILHSLFYSINYSVRKCSPQHPIGVLMALQSYAVLHSPTQPYTALHSPTQPCARLCPCILSDGGGGDAGGAGGAGASWAVEQQKHTHERATQRCGRSRVYECGWSE